MPVSNILEIPVLTETMAQKTIGVNMAIQAIEKAIAGALEIATSAATFNGEDILIPFDAANDLSPRQALRAIFYRLLPGATANFDLIHPENPHLFIIRNDTTRAATLKTTALGGDTVLLPAAATFLVYCDGTNMVKMDFSLVSITQAYDFDISFWGKPEPDQVIARFLVGRNVVFPGNFAGAIGRVGVDPVSTRTFTVRDDGTSIGTISVNDNGNFTFTTSGGGPRTVLDGSILTITNQAGAPDPLMTDIEIFLMATTAVNQPIP